MEDTRRWIAGLVGVTGVMGAPGVMPEDGIRVLSPEDGKGTWDLEA
jgi:hypothetical protein